MNKEYDGFKVYVCMFVVLDFLLGKWVFVYVYVKLMMIDDVFMMLGLVNINICSMEVDSEFNICYENGDVIKRLWW